MSVLFELIGRHGEPIAWWQMCLRASLIFLIGIAYIRIAGARAFGKWGALDILLAIIIGSNFSRTITGGAPFFATLVATAWLIALHYALAHAAAGHADPSRVAAAYLERGGAISVIARSDAPPAPQVDAKTRSH